MPGFSSFQITFCVAVLFTQCSFGGLACIRLFNESKQDNVDSNNFTTDRTLEQYLEFFDSYRGNKFLEALKSLTLGSKWIDMGAGRAIALKKALKMFPNITEGVALSQSKDQFPTMVPNPKTLKEIEGDTLQSMFAKGRLDNYKNNTDLLSCIFGPLSYMHSIQLAMIIYLNLLKNGGSLFMVLQLGRGEGRNFNEGKQNSKSYNGFMNQSGLEHLGIINWLQKITGIEFEVEIKEFYKGTTYEQIAAITIKKIRDENEVPAAKLKTKIDTVPPFRIFE